MAIKVWGPICPKIKWLFLALLPESTKKSRAEAHLAEARGSSPHLAAGNSSGLRHNEMNTTLILRQRATIPLDSIPHEMGRFQIGQKNHLLANQFFLFTQPCNTGHNGPFLSNIHGEPEKLLRPRIASAF